MRVIKSMKLIACVLFATAFYTAAFAQTGPAQNSRTVTHDTIRTPVLPKLPTDKRLPPAMQQELRRSQGARTIVSRDTIKAADRMRQFINDTVDHQLGDSTLTYLDTAVSLSHKDWLDSELVEIPELTRLGTRVHYNYPQSIMVETDVQPVLFDSGLLAGMNPISRENLPFFDQSPIPLSLPAGRPFEAFLEAGGGNIYLPSAKAWLTTTLSPRTSLDARADIRSLSTTPLHHFLDLAGTFIADIGEDPGSSAFHSSELTLRLGYTDKALSIRGDSGGITRLTDHKLSQIFVGASLAGDGSDRFHYEISGHDREFRDNLLPILTESAQSATALFHFDPYISHFRLIGEAQFDQALLTIQPSTGLRTLSDPMSTYAFKGLFGRRKGEAIEWYGGVELLGGHSSLDGATATYTSISPIARIRLPFNPRWEFGASYEPRVQLASEAVLSGLNPFFSPYEASRVIAKDSIPLDPRSVVIDKINLQVFMNYMLSPDDEVRLEARFITRQREPVFEQHGLRDSSSVFSVTPKDTRRLQFSFNSNLLFFTKDVLTAGVDVSSATMVDEDRELPFEPSLKIQAAYHFNSFSETIRPMIEFRSIARKDRNLSFLNAEARIGIARNISILLRAENILGGPDDFWTGYSEYPRSVWASVRYSF